MRSVSAKQRENAASLAVALALSLSLEVRGSPPPDRPQISVRDVCQILSDKVSEKVDVKATTEAMAYWVEEFKKFHEMTPANFRTYSRMMMLEEMYQHFQRIHSAHNAELQRIRSKLQLGTTSSVASAYAEIDALANEIVTKMKSGPWTHESVAEEFGKLCAIMKEKALPKPEKVANREHMVALIKHIDSSQQLEAIKTVAKMIMRSPEGRDLDYVFPRERGELCASFNMADPSVPVSDSVEMLMHDATKIQAYIISEQRQKKA